MENEAKSPLPDVDVSHILEQVLGCKWTIHVLGQIHQGVQRPGEFARSADGLTTKVLNERLVKLVRFSESYWLVPLGVLAVVILTILVLTGIRRSNVTNMVIVSVTLASLMFFVLAGLPVALRAGSENLIPFFKSVSSDSSPWPGFFEARVLMFVAYTGYSMGCTR
jgi:amino acid transporter